MSARDQFQQGLDDAAAGRNPYRIADLDVPTTRLEADMRALVARQKAQRLAEGIAAEARHQMDPAETAIEQAFMQIACDCPDVCPCDDRSQP
jgi:hypothetical protein